MHTVVETPTYLSRLKQAGVTEDERRGIVDMLAADPMAGAIIAGSGGARKVRYAKEGAGKSGGYRLIAYYAADDVPVFLLDIYGKGQRASLSQSDKNALAKVLPKIAPAYRRSCKAAAAAIKKGRRDR